MRTRWVFRKLTADLPPWASSLFSQFNTIKESSTSPGIKTFHLVLDHADVSLIISQCGREGFSDLGRSLHASFIKNTECRDLSTGENFRDIVVIWNSLLSMYVKWAELDNAVKLFDHMPVRDTISWNSLISGHLQNGGFGNGFEVLRRMRKSGVCGIDQVTLTTLLSGCDSPKLACVTRMVHGLTFLSGYEREITVGNALITSYFKCECSSSGRRVFEEMIERNVISWTAVISGLARNQLYENGLELFAEMRSSSVEPNPLTYLSLMSVCTGLQALNKGRKIHGLVLKHGIDLDMFIGSALMDMYFKCGRIEDALLLFESSEELDEVSLTVLLVGFAQNGYEEEAIRLFVKMIRVGNEIDPNVISSVLGAFGVDSSLSLGQQIHCIIIKKSFISNPFVTNGLINMYSKCGNLDESINIFNRMTKRSFVSWNSMIAAFARHGDGYRVLKLYEEMRVEGMEPTDVTFLSLLHACSHVGLVDKGMELMESMAKIHGIQPRAEHYACVVDMLGRAGLLNEARTFIEGLPEKPSILVWQALLGACGIHGDSKLGKYAADRLHMEASGSPGTYALMANIYSYEGRWKDRARTIKRMREMGMAKEPGTSWIEIEKKLHSFVVADKMHPQVDLIYGVLAGLFGLLTDEGYVPDERFILCYLDQDGEKALSPEQLTG